MQIPTRRDGRKTRSVFTILYNFPEIATHLHTPYRYEPQISLNNSNITTGREQDLSFLTRFFTALLFLN